MKKGFLAPVIMLVATMIVISSSSRAEADPLLVTYLEPTETVLPPDAAVSGLITVGNDKKVDRVQVPGCVEGDTSFYPSQRVRHFKNLEIIIISQTDPLPKGTMLSLLAISQCTDGDQLYHKVLAVAIP